MLGFFILDLSDFKPSVVVLLVQCNTGKYQITPECGRNPTSRTSTCRSVHQKYIFCLHWNELPAKLQRQSHIFENDFYSRLLIFNLLIVRRLDFSSLTLDFLVLGL